MRILSLSAMAIAAILATDTASAQIRNVQLLGRFNKYRRYNDVWAFRHSNGKEYALLGVSTGISIVDVSNPARPKEVKFISGTRSSTWRDVKNFGDWIYAVTENSGEGMMVIDMTNAANPVLKQFWGRNASWRHSHNIAMDWGTGIAYVCGTSRGTLLVDVKTNPASPRQVGTYFSPYLHDLAVQHGFGYFCDQNGNNLRIVDVRNPASLRQLGIVRQPGRRIAHNVWASHDDKIACTTNETSSGPIGVFDVSNKRAPKLLATIRASSSFSAIPHNVYITDYVGHASYYTEGMITFDLSNPSKPVQVGQYDTFPGSSGGFNGAWGCTTALDSGHVFVSDLSSGLYILKPKSTAAYYGGGTKGTGGKLPRIRQRGAPYIGNATYRVMLMNAKASSPALMIIGGKKANLTVAGLNLLVDLTAPPPILVGMATNASGQISVPFGIPNQAGLNGVNLFMQFLVFDSGSSSSLGLSASKGMQIGLFTK